MRVILIFIMSILFDSCDIVFMSIDVLISLKKTVETYNWNVWLYYAIKVFYMLISN